MRINFKRKLGLILIFCFVLTSVKLLGEEQNLITIKADNATLESILKKIEVASKYSLLYNYDDVSKFKGISINAINKTVSEVLEIVLKNTGLGFRIKENTIIISKPVPVKNEPQNKKVSGKILSNNGEPLAGVHVWFKGTDKGVISDSEGFYELSIPDDEGTIVVSFIGFTTKEVAIRKRDTIDIELLEAVNELNEVVVETGYQTLSKRELASAITKVDMEKIELVSKSSVDQMLAGQIPGMMVLQTSGEPGATPTIRIRGTSSIIGTRSPLWVWME